MNIPYITREQMQRVDDLMVDQYKIELLQMMEHAGYHTADFIRQKFPKNSHITILAGKGGNGGGVLVTARRIQAWGFDISIVLGQEIDLMKEIPKKQAEILRKLDVEFLQEIPNKTNIILDGLVGYSLYGEPNGRVGELIKQANQIDATRISLDIPSGLDADSGPSQTVLEADYTLTLALPKTAMQFDQSQRFLGQVLVVDIGIVPNVFKQLDIEVSDIFDKSSIISIN